MRIERYGTPPTPDLLAAAGLVYERAFSQPPYAGADTAGDLRDRVERYGARDGFRLSLARDDDSVTGLALSVRAFPGDWWRDRCAGALGPERTAEWLEPAIREIVHVAVEPARQGQGIGRMLLEDAVDDADVASAVLTVQPGAEPAKHLYLSHGFEVLAEEFHLTPDAPAFWLMARRPALSEVTDPA